MYTYTCIYIYPQTELPCKCSGGQAEPARHMGQAYACGGIQSPSIGVYLVCLYMRVYVDFIFIYIYIYMYKHISVAILAQVFLGLGHALFPVSLFDNSRMQHALSLASPCLLPATCQPTWIRHSRSQEDSRTR